MKVIIRRQDIAGLVIMVIIGLALTFLGFTKLKNAQVAKRWPFTQGTIISSEVAGAIRYYPTVTYTYSVDSVVYNSNRISNINFNTKNRSVVVEFLKKYPTGSEIKVYYNASKPSDALLEPGINAGNFLLLGFGILILAVPVILMIHSLLKSGKKH